LISKPDFYSLGRTLIPEIFMARLSRFVIPGQVQHVIVRGKQPHPECVGGDRKSMRYLKETNRI